jgi:HlyD family secretion protein
MFRAVIFFLVGILALLTAACRDSGEADILVLAVQPGTFEIKIPAFGELQSVTSTPLSAPPQLRGRQTIAWIAADNSLVRKGDAVARLNSLYYVEQIKVEEANIAKIKLEIAQKERQMQKEKSDIQGQISVTAIEKKMADVFAARDETIYSRNKIIEDGIDLDYLKEKERHYQKKGTQLERKTQAELQLLSSKRKAVQTKLDQYQEAMNSLEIKAPNDGLFVIEKRWGGEKYRVGMDIWGGEKLGTLPDLDHMEAKLFVLESEASGLKDKLRVSLTIDLEPDRFFSGQVIGIDTIAKPLDEKSPLKYFEVKAGLDITDKAIMKPGAQVKASILVSRRENVICIPNQALLFEQDKSYIHVKTSRRVKKRRVEIGERSLTQTVIVKGLQAAEEVLLGNPQSGG